jgi:hypothetical protein
MRTMWLFLRVAAAASAVAVTAVRPVAAQISGADAEKAAAAFLQAFVSGDVTRMKEHFAEKVRIDGDLRFLSPAADQTVTRDQLADGYGQFFERIGREKWTGLIKNAKPTLTRAAKDGEVVTFVKAGDFVYDLHFREAVRGARSDLDEAIVFVFRDIGGKPMIVGHYADY